MADLHDDLTAQASLSSFDFDFNFDHRISRSPLSVAFDAQSIQTYSTDFEYGDLGILTSQFPQQEKDHRGPTAQTSYDPILPRHSNAELYESNLVCWETGCDPDNPLYWSLPRRLGISLVVSMLTFAVSLASSVFSEDVDITAARFGVGERVTVLGVSLYVLGFACGESRKRPLMSVWRMAETDEHRSSRVRSSIRTLWPLTPAALRFRVLRRLPNPFCRCSRCADDSHLSFSGCCFRISASSYRARNPCRPLATSRTRYRDSVLAHRYLRWNNHWAANRSIYPCRI